MASTVLTVDIGRPVEDVFAVLVDVENAAKWSRAIEETITTPGPFGVGTRRRAVVRGVGGRTTENEMELTEFVPDRRLAMRSVSGFPFEVRIAIDLNRLDAGTRLEWDISFQPGGALRLVTPVLIAIVRRSFATDLVNLKAMMEAGAL
jgi:uncharacterized protein YndB with AHSA1/START domain